MKKILYLAAALLCAGTVISAQNTVTTPATSRMQQTVSPSAAIYTSFNINSPVCGGAATDESWNRLSSENLIDTYYVPVIPRIPEELAPVKKQKGEKNPFMDNTRKIFKDGTLSVGQAGSYDNASAEKELLAIELFGYSRKVPADLAAAVRACVADGAARRSRQYVVDAQCQLGGSYDGSPVYYGGDPGNFHFSPRIEALYCRGVRYVISGVVADYYTHQYYSSEKTKKVTFETLMTVYLTAYDLDRHTILQTCWINATGTGSRQDLADKDALGCFESKAFNMVMNNFPVITTFASFAGTGSKGTIKKATLAAGQDRGITKTDRFYIYTADNPYGKKIGKAKVTRVASNSCECKITGGRKKVTAAINSEATVFLLSQDQALF